VRVVVDVGSPVPPYEQLRAQIAALIAARDLADGARLPPIRQLASDLGVAPGTVARAYAELEAEGRVVSARARGTRVLGSSAVDDVVLAAADTFVACATAHGVDPAAAAALVRSRFEAGLDEPSRSS
jgi:GntR family transcriptional regulator